MTPTAETKNETAVETPEVSFNPETQIRSTQKVFDVASKEFVDIVKIAPKRSVTNMEQFVTLMNNDATAILAIINDGLESYDQKALAKQTDVPVYAESEDGTLEPFSGEVLPEAATAKLKASVLALAKNMYGFAKSQKPEQKKAAKENALNMILSAPGSIDLLKAM